MSKESIYIKKEEGEIEEISITKFLSDFEKEEEVPNYVSPDGDENHNMDAETVVKSLYMLAVGGKDLPEQVEDYSDYYKTMKTAVKKSAEYAKAKKEEAEAAKKAEADAKENEKKAKEEAKAKTELRRNAFLDAAGLGFSKSEDRFRDELVALRENLPEGVSIVVGDGDSFAMNFSDDVTEESLSTALGYMFNAQSQNEFMANAYQFLIGDIANELMSRGVYDSMIQCGKALESMILSKFNKKLSGRNVESYARMAKRIGIEYRNAKADPTAYLAISDMPYTPKPTKSEYPDKGDLKLKMHEWEKEAAKIDAERIRLAAILKAGGVTEKDSEGNEAFVEILGRKEILPLVHKVKVAFGTAKDEDPGKMTVTDHMRQWCEAQLILDNFLGVHKKNVVIVHPGNDKATVELSKQDLLDLIESSKNSIVNMIYGDELPQLIEGKKTVMKPRMVDKTVGDKTTKVIEKDKDGNQVKDPVEENVYPKFLSYRV
jgi:Sec-independent protein translocase protein TatA